MASISNQELIDLAASVIRPKTVNGMTIGDVGCALITDQGNLYTGVCIDTSSGMGYCAEHNAIGTMITAGEYHITKIVAVWKNDQGDLHVLSPCGRCREFMRQIDAGNLQTQVILDVDKSVPLTYLLPYHDWFHKI